MGTITDISKAREAKKADGIMETCRDLWGSQSSPFNPDDPAIKAIVSLAGKQQTSVAMLRRMRRREVRRLHHLDALEQAAAQLAGRYACADSLASHALQAIQTLSVPYRLRTCAGYLRHGKAEGCFGDALADVPAGAGAAADALLSRPMILNYSAAIRLRELCQSGKEHIKTMLFRAVAAAVYQRNDTYSAGDMDTLFLDALSGVVSQRLMLAPELLEQLGRVKTVVKANLAVESVPIWDIAFDSESPPNGDAGRLDILVPDLFMKRVDDNGGWMLMNSDNAEHLHDLSGETFAEVYEEMEANAANIPSRQAEARTVWLRATRWATDWDNVRIRFVEAARRHGTWDSRSMTKAAVPAGAINVAMHMPDGPVDDALLAETAQVLTRLLDRILDLTDIDSHDGRRPVAVSVAGLADVCYIQGISYRHPMVTRLHRHIRATVANAAAETSAQLAQALDSFHCFDTGSSNRHWWAEGKLPQDRHRECLRRLGPVAVAERDMFEQPLREQVMKGMRNDQLCADQVMEARHFGFYGDVFGSPDFGDPYPRALWNSMRPDNGGVLRRVNPWVIMNLASRGAWVPEMSQAIEMSHGSVMGVQVMSEETRMLLLGGAEIPQGILIDLAAVAQEYTTGPVEFTLYYPWDKDGEVDHLGISRAFFRAWALGLQQTPRCLTTGYSTETDTARAAES